MSPAAAFMSPCRPIEIGAEGRRRDGTPVSEPRRLIARLRIGFPVCCRMPHGSRCREACAGCKRNQPARATPAFLHSVAAACLTRSGRSVLSSSRFLLEPLGRIAGLLGLLRLACCSARHLTNTADRLSRCLAQRLAEVAEPLSKTAGSPVNRAP